MKLIDRFPLAEFSIIAMIVCGAYAEGGPNSDASGRTQDRPNVHVQLGHSNVVTSVAFSPDGHILASGSWDKTVRLWEVSTGREFRTLSGQSGLVTSVAFSPDGQILASGSGTAGARGTAAGESDGTVKLWDVTSGRELQSFGRNGRSVKSIAFSPDGHVLACGTEGMTVELWDVTSKRELRTLGGHSGEVNSVAFSPDGRLLASGSDDRTIRIWDVTSGRVLHVLRGNSNPVSTIAFSPDGRVLASGSGYGPEVKLWDVATGRALRNFTGQSDSLSLAFSPVSSILASGSQDKTTKLWDPVDGRDLRTVGGHADSVSSVAFSPDGRILAEGNNDSTIELWDVQSERKVRTLSGRSAEINSVAFSPDRRVLASGTADGTVWLWDLANRGEPRILRGHSEAVTSLAFSPRKPLLISASTADGTIRFWNVSSGLGVRTLSGQPFTSVAFSPDGSELATGSEDMSGLSLVKRQTIRLWDAASGRELHTHVTLSDTVTSIAFSPKGGILASAGVKIAILWDMVSGRALHTLSGHSGNVTSTAFSTDGNLLASSSEDKTVKLWDASNGRELHTFGGHTDAVTSVAFSPDGRVLASGSWDKTIKLWDVMGGHELQSIVGHVDAVTSVSISSDGHMLSSASRDGTVRIWEPSSGMPVGKKSDAVASWKISTGKEVATLISSREREWLVVDPSGRFDADSLENISGFSWVISDDPFRPLSPEIFMRDYYEPRLLPRLLACHEAEDTGVDSGACKKAFKPVPALTELNRIQPEVKIVGVTRGASADEVLVDVEVAGKEDPTQKNGKTKTAVYDLRLFRDGQIVGQWPEPTGGMSGAEDIGQWRNESKVPMTGGQPKTVHQFKVRLARRDAGHPVKLTAYAFNEDRVKSETASNAAYTVPSDGTLAKPRAFVIAIGINAYQNPDWKLGFAVKDARDLAGALERIEGYDVVSVPLVSANDGGSKVDQATKANIQGVLALLAGSGEAERGRLRSVIGLVVNSLQKATPDDLVIIAFSGHGYTDLQARFYLLPSDSGTDSKITDAVLAKFISSDELSQWLRDVDAGEMVMLIDACHSAASVPEGFKPGPMGDRGLGQLAYDKGMQILAATQADNVALESEKLGQGLLTYALVDDGLKAHRAAPEANGAITINAWLHYAEKRVPVLYDDIQAGKLKLVGFDPKIGTSRQLAAKDPTIDKIFYADTASHAQTPVLFNFYRQSADPIIQMH